MNYLRKVSKSLFPGFFYENPLSYLINPLHGEALQSDFPIDVKERNGTYIVHAELPGVNKENVEVSIDGDCVTISADIEQFDQRSSDEKIIRSERYIGAVSRMICLPTPIDKKSSAAHFKNGVLELLLSKAKSANGSKLEIK